MFNVLKGLLIGKPLENEALSGEKFGVFWGLPILSSDAISSVAYAGQEILIVLLPAIGMLAFKQLTYISAGIIILLMILILSYRQIIDCYPNGGGAFIVAKENLGILAGVTAGSALSVDYILTVAVSISSGVDQIVSAIKILEPFRLPLCAVIIIIMTIGNLRGIKESARMFSIPTYLFIFSMLFMLAVGFIKVLNGYEPEPIIIMQDTLQPLTLYLLLTAFTNGCAALTGVEAVSNAVPNFKEPSTKHAKTVLLLLSFLVLMVFGGISIISNFYPTHPEEGAMLIQIAGLIFGKTHFFFYIITVLSFTILVLAANTAYFGFPNLISVMAKEGFVPKQLNMRGDRLSYSNGIILLSGIAMVLIFAFRANVTSLIGLYAIGVFISFTLSQTGMLFRWFKKKGEHWIIKASVNGFGAMVSFAVVIVIAITKFTQGTWIVIILIPILVFVMLKIKKHYTAVKNQLWIKSEELDFIDLECHKYVNRVIVPIESVNNSSIRALRFAKTFSDNVVAFCVSIDEESGKEVQEKYERLKTDIPLIVKYSPFRKVVDPLIKFIESAEYECKQGDMVTVIIPQFTVKRWWHRFLHNQTRIFIERELLKHKHIVVAVIPLQLNDDEVELEHL